MQRLPGEDRHEEPLQGSAGRSADLRRAFLHAAGDRDTGGAHDRLPGQRLQNRGSQRIHVEPCVDRPAQVVQTVVRGAEGRNIATREDEQEPGPPGNPEHLVERQADFVVRQPVIFDL
jgi:hypothetical protein